MLKKQVAGLSNKVQCMLLEVGQADQAQCRGMRSSQDDRRCDPCLMCFFPARCAQAPLVAGPESRKTQLGASRYQVVASRTGKCQEFFRNPGTDDVAARVIRTGIATSIAVKPGNGIIRAGHQRFPQHIQFRVHKKLIIQSVAATGITIEKPADLFGYLCSVCIEKPILKFAQVGQPGIGQQTGSLGRSFAQ